MSSQIHQGGCCCSGLGVEEVSGSFMSMGVAAKLIKMIKRDDFFFAHLASELCSDSSSHGATLQPSTPAELESEVLEMTLNYKKSLL